MKTAALTLLAAGSAAAFAPAQSSRQSTSLSMADGDKSQALPFLARPKHLDGALAADVGFDPLGFGGGDKASLMNMREAELKHSRLAMLAAGKYKK